MTFSGISSLLRQALIKAKEQARAVERSVLAVTKVQVEPPDFIALFANNVGCRGVNLWLGAGEHSLVGFGTACELTARGKHRFTSITDAWQKLTSDAVVTGDGGPIAIGGFRFDTDRCGSELWRGFPDAAFTIPSITLHSKSGGSYLIIADLVTPQVDVEGRIVELRELWQSVNSEKASSQSVHVAPVAIREAADAKGQWAVLVKRALNVIDQRELEKVVVARTIDLEADFPITLADVIRKLRSDNPHACVFAFGRYGAHFVGATPEMLFSADSGHFRTMALAGSAPRGSNPEEDQRFGEALLHSAKDRREHSIVVNAIRETLAPLCAKISVDSVPSLHRLPRVQHLVTHFEGEIGTDNSLLDIVGHLHPTPAVGGVAVEPAMAFLQAHEGIDRGWYASPVGWIDSDGTGEFMVSLRSGLLDGKCATLFAGCGIVAGSEPESEFHETGLKFATMMDAIVPKETKRFEVGSSH